MPRFEREGAAAQLSVWRSRHKVLLSLEQLLLLTCPSEGWGKIERGLKGITFEGQLLCSACAAVCSNPPPQSRCWNGKKNKPAAQQGKQTCQPYSTGFASVWRVCSREGGCGVWKNILLSLVFISGASLLFIWFLLPIAIQTQPFVPLPHLSLGAYWSMHRVHMNFSHTEADVWIIIPLP